MCKNVVLCAASAAAERDNAPRPLSPNPKWRHNRARTCACTCACTCMCMSMCMCMCMHVHVHACACPCVSARPVRRLPHLCLTGGECLSVHLLERCRQRDRFGHAEERAQRGGLLRRRRHFRHATAARDAGRSMGGCLMHPRGVGTHPRGVGSYSRSGVELLHQRNGFTWPGLTACGMHRFTSRRCAPPCTISLVTTFSTPGDNCSLCTWYQRGCRVERTAQHKLSPTPPQ